MAKINSIDLEPIFGRVPISSLRTSLIALTELSQEDSLPLIEARRETISGFDKLGVSPHGEYLPLDNPTQHICHGDLRNHRDKLLD